MFEDANVVVVVLAGAVDWLKDMRHVSSCLLCAPLTTLHCTLGTFCSNRKSWVRTIRLPWASHSWFQPAVMGYPGES
jgi:hypothetical protein